MAAQLKRLAGGPNTPLTIHLRQEVDRLNAVLSLVGEQLRALRSALAGTIALGPDLAECLEALAAGRPPPRWLRVRCADWLCSQA